LLSLILAAKICAMSDNFQQLLDAAIVHLEDLKSRGVRFVPVSAEAITALNQSPRIIAPKKNSAPEISAPRSAQKIISTPSQRVEQFAPAVVPPVVTRYSSSEKIAAFAELRSRVLACVKCSHLVASRKNVVFGVGSIDAQLMFVGEAPGADEDEQGEPFVGKAGQLLTKIIQTMGLSRETVYIANILKCRPDTPGQASGNRKPTPEEMQTCIPFLHKQIDLIQPKVLVALGATAVEGLLGKTVGITKLRGNWQTYRGIPLMPTYHPAFLLRNQALSEKRKVWEDMLQVMEKLAMPISEKQRNYFLGK
jgi:uracil-DNA glycosylase family 4